MKETVKIFKALGDETRLKILVLLSERKFCARGIANHLGISESAVSQHLKILKDAKIVKGKKDGYYISYTVTKDSLIVGQAFISEILEAKFIEKGGERKKKFISIDWEIPDKCDSYCKNTKGKCGKN